MDRQCPGCGEDLFVHRTTDSVVKYCPGCGHESKESAPRRPVPIEKRPRTGATVTPIRGTKTKSPKEKPKPQRDRVDYVSRRAR